MARPARGRIAETVINLRQLRYFIRTIEAGTITRAAEQLYVAQPALGMQIRQLEEEVGVSLVRRHSRGISPTRAGQLMYERACQILRLVEETEREVAAAGRSETRNVVIGLTNGFTSLLGRDFLRQARQQLPGIRLGIVEERSLVLVEALERHDIDLALAYEVHERPSLIRIALLEEEMLFVSAPVEGRAGLLAQPIAFNDIVRRELVLPGHKDGVRELLQSTAKRLACELQIVMDVSSVSMMKEMVASGQAAAVMPFGNTIADVEAGRMCGQRIVEPVLKRTLYLACSLSRAPVDSEEQLLELVSGAAHAMARRLGPMATPLDALHRPLAPLLAELRQQARPAA